LIAFLYRRKDSSAKAQPGIESLAVDEHGSPFDDVPYFFTACHELLLTPACVTIDRTKCSFAMNK